MLRLRTIACLATAAVSLSSAPAGSIDFTVPEPQPAVHIMRVELLPGGAPAEPEQVHRRLLERCRLLLPESDIPPRLRRRGGKIFLHIYTPLSAPSPHRVDQRLQTCLNHSPSTAFLRIHPDSARLLKRRDIRAAIARYEQSMTTWLESPRTTPPPPLPLLPHTGPTAGYMLAEHPTPSAAGNTDYEYLIVCRPEVARADGLLVTNHDILSCRRVAADTTAPPALELQLNKEAAARFASLTRSIAADKGKLAIVSGATVLCQLNIPLPLGDRFRLYDSHPRALQLALLPPLPCRVQLTRANPTPTMGSYD